QTVGMNHVEDEMSRASKHVLGMVAMFALFATQSLDAQQAQGSFGSLGEAIHAAAYAIRADTAPAGMGEQYIARNPAQRFQASFSSAGLQLSTGSWKSVWRMRSVGYGKRQLSVGLAEIAASGHRVELRRRLGVTEWYVNKPEGLEQGFTLSGPP